MRKSYDDLIVIHQKIGVLSSFVGLLHENLLLKPLSWIIHWPICLPFRMDNYYVAKAYLCYLKNHHRYPDLIHFLITVVTESNLDKDQIWAICKLGTHAIQVRQLNPDAVILAKIEALTVLIPESLAVQVSYNCSYTLVCLSLWRFQRGQMEMAIKLAALAIQADPSWAYPDYLLGWYGCFTLEVDPTPYFFEAIRKDWRYAKRVLNDKIIQNQTDIIKHIKHKLLISNAKKSKISLG